MIWLDFETRGYKIGKGIKGQRSRSRVQVTKKDPAIMRIARRCSGHWHNCVELNDDIVTSEYIAYVIIRRYSMESRVTCQVACSHMLPCLTKYILADHIAFGSWPYTAITCRFDHKLHISMPRTMKYDRLLAWYCRLSTRLSPQTLHAQILEIVLIYYMSLSWSRDYYERVLRSWESILMEVHVM